MVEKHFSEVVDKNLSLPPFSKSVIFDGKRGLGHLFKIKIKEDEQRSLVVKWPVF